MKVAGIAGAAIGFALMVGGLSQIAQNQEPIQRTFEILDRGVTALEAVGVDTDEAIDFVSGRRGAAPEGIPADVLRSAIAAKIEYDRSVVVWADKAESARQRRSIGLMRVAIGACAMVVGLALLVAGYLRTNFSNANR